MEFLKELLPFISMICVFGLYVIRTENEIKILKLDQKLTEKITENREKIAQVASDNASKISGILIQSGHTETKLEEIKGQVSEIYKKIVGETHGT